MPGMAHLKKNICETCVDITRSKTCMPKCSVQRQKQPITYGKSIINCNIRYTYAKQPIFLPKELLLFVPTICFLFDRKIKGVAER